MEKLYHAHFYSPSALSIVLQGAMDKNNPNYHDLSLKWLFEIACELWAWCCEEPCCGWTAQSWLASPNTGIPPATNISWKFYSIFWSRNILKLYFPTLQSLYECFEYSIKEKLYFFQPYKACMNILNILLKKNYIFQPYKACMRTWLLARLQLASLCPEQDIIIFWPAHLAIVISTLTSYLYNN